MFIVIKKFYDSNSPIVAGKTNTFIDAERILIEEAQKFGGKFDDVIEGVHLIRKGNTIEEYNRYSKIVDQTGISSWFYSPTKKRMSELIAEYNIIDVSQELNQSNDDLSPRILDCVDNKPTYEKISLHEHILKKPEIYIGNTDSTEDKMWIHDSNTKRIIFTNVTIVSGLYKIVDELYLNAYDHCFRDTECKTIKISIDRINNTITIFNSGNGIPIQMHNSGVYIPEMVFGHLLTSSNYDHIVATRGGYGAKLANIFSKEFIVETVDKTHNKKYVQRFSDNMRIVNPALITDIDESVEPYTKIILKPDLNIFGLDKLTDDMVKLFEKRAFDLAVCTFRNGVKVFLNDELIKIESIEDYMKLYFEELPSEIVYHEFNDRWRIAIVYDPDIQLVSRVISFVNGIYVHDGTHIDYIKNQLNKKIIPKDQNELSFSYNCVIFIDAIIENPLFSSQIRDELITNASNFGSECVLDSNFIENILNKFS